MKLFSTLLLFITVLQLNAQQNISDVRRLNEGEIVTVTGIVTNGAELGDIRYMQDTTAGLGVYDTKLANVKRGDSITVTGEIDSYSNLFEIGNVSSFVVHSSGNKLPEPKVITIDKIGEDYEGQIIEIKDIEIETGGTFAGDENYNFVSGSETGILRVNKQSPIVGQVIPTGKISLIAICSQYSFNSPSEGYQLLPRTMDDFISESAINFTSPVEVSNINKNGFTLSWSTDVEATPAISYSLGYLSHHSWIKTAFGNTIQSGDEFHHEVVISGLDPASIVHATAYSTTESDTTKSSELIFATESNSSGEIKAYFNTEVNHDLSTGTLAQTINRAMEDTLIAYINRAQISVDLCIYNINNGGISNISEALNSAKSRGIQIRVITCESTTHSGIEELDQSIPFIERPVLQSGGIMHNKFAIFDVNSTDSKKPWIWSGSTNLTYDQLNTDPNNMIFIQDQTLAIAYFIEFEEMWGSAEGQPNFSNSKFGADKQDNTPHEFIIGGNRVELYFSPSDGTNQKIINSIGTAENDLNVQTMLITRSDLALAIKDAQERGAEVHVITQRESSNTETVNNILNESLPAGKFVFDDEGNNKLHHKLAIVDANYAASDPQVITGSHNWSNSANDRNDENTLIIHNPEIANEYLQQFAYRFAENGGNLVVSAEVIGMENIYIYPNPTLEKVTISSATTIKSVQLFSASGSKIKEINSVGSFQAEIDFTSLKTGLYILKIQAENNRFNSYKIIKK